MAYSTVASARCLPVEAEVDHAQLKHDDAAHIGEELERLEDEEGYEDGRRRARLQSAFEKSFLCQV